MKAAVLGAGYMGGAITFPLADNGVEVNLWGTWLDDGIMSKLRAGTHPKLNKSLPAGVELFLSTQLQQAVDGVDAVFMAVSSEGFLPVFSKFIQCRDIEGQTVFALTKGLVEYRGRIERISEAALGMYGERFGRKLPWVSVGGPVKAVELASHIPTLSVYAVSGATGFKKGSFQTPYYRISRQKDVCGVELCSAFKNVYAISLGICDGLYSGQGKEYHNFSSLLFNQAAEELKEIVGAAGGNKDTAYGGAGIGDLYVTSQSGRNRRYGELVGKGAGPDKAYREMFLAQEIAEGYHALKLGYDYVKRLGIENRLPLFGSLYDIIYRFGDPRKTLTAYTAGL
ncbi:MAG: NAD(P)H-dependent glycerol-3-phosphate dehydrogenase [Actinomycetota bacterium]